MSRRSTGPSAAGVKSFPAGGSAHGPRLVRGLCFWFAPTGEAPAPESEGAMRAVERADTVGPLAAELAAKRPHLAPLGRRLFASVAATVAAPAPAASTWAGWLGDWVWKLH
ncbi:hypothetical protein ACSSS7_006862 [Eimeria intestinalis]